MTVKDIRPPEELLQFKESMKSRRQSAALGFYSEPWKHKKKDGTIIDVEVSAHVITFRGHEAKLVMVGDGPEKPGAEKLTRELGLERDVLFLGNQDCMEELLPLADVFLLPSSSESFGLVALEAMACGTPVVATRVGGLQTVVTSESGVLVPPGDAEALAHAIESLLDDMELRI